MSKKKTVVFLSNMFELIWRYIRNLFFDTYVTWRRYFKTMGSGTDYQIYKIRVIYTCDPKKYGDDPLPTLWKYIDQEEDEPHTSYIYYPVNNVDMLNDLIATAPECVSDIKIETSFWFRFEKKKHMNTEPTETIKWPPGECIIRSPAFTMPIKSARLVALDETYDVTSKIKKFSGPFGDFYGKKINPALFFLTWEPSDIRSYDYLEIVDIAGTIKEYAIE